MSSWTSQSDKIAPVQPWWNNLLFMSRPDFGNGFVRAARIFFEHRESDTGMPLFYCPQVWWSVNLLDFKWQKDNLSAILVERQRSVRRGNTISAINRANKNTTNNSRRRFRRLKATFLHKLRFGRIVGSFDLCAFWWIWGNFLKVNLQFVKNFLIC